MLTPKQERFCQEYCIDLNGTQAAIRAGYSKKCARQIAEENLSKPDIKSRIAVVQAEIAERNRLKQDDIVEELRALAFWNIQDFLAEGNTIADLLKLARKSTKPVIGIKTKTVNLPGDISETTVEIKFADKKGALVDLGRHLGMFKEDNSPKKLKIKITRK
ncbi:terminase small subunit [Nostoc ellipsosporum NOK]|nr:terminase small subunit [Nostoc ellipsosporum NOK]